MSDKPAKAKTKFEQDLETYFPEVYKLHQVGKWDKWVWEVVYSMLEMVDSDATGRIIINYSKGKIDGLHTGVERLHGKAKSPNLSSEVVREKPDVEK